MAQNHKLVDESLYSRQLYAIGLDAMKSIVSSKVLISNLTPLAVEICKNIILCGCGTLTLADSDKISEKDLGLNYYITEKDFGKKRSDVMGKRMQELNKNVIVNKYSGIVDEKICSKYDLIVFVDPQFDDSTLNLNEYCRSKSIKTIYTSTNGIYGFIFCDFNNFITTDINGEKIRSGIIIDISEDVLTMDKSHDLELNVEIKIENTTYKVIKVIDRFKIKIDKSICKKNIGSVYVEIKSKVEIKFKSLRESISNPEFVITDFAKMDKPQLLHDINIKIRQNIKIDEAEKTDLYKKIIKSYDGCIVPLNSVIGGIVAHNITAGICNKYQPIKQWLYYDIEELYNDDNNTNDDKFYSNQIKVIGKKLQSKLNDTKLFIVGSGAIGCEHLKNFVMFGIGNIVITDLDQIEKSNLNRQFLFRNTDIGKYKSQVAAENAIKMNPKVKIESKLNKVGIETENIFNEKFYSNIDFIVNALDNVNARNYMDQQAINYNLPLLESGTLGLKGNVQIVIPNLTESYQSSTDQAEESIPVCTLKNFPYEIAHCIQFAREQFESQFVQPFQTYNSLKKLDEHKLKEKLDKSMPNELFDIHSNLNLIKNSTFEMFCEFYNQHYRQKIHDLIIQFPENHVTNDGERFWSGTKKFPKVIDFTEDNEICKNLFESFQQIMSDIGYKVVDNFKEIKSNINSELKENNNVKVAVTTEDDIKNKEADINMLDNNKIKEDIINFITTTNYKFKEIEFEKDDDSNGHIKFITACSNLRAMNYDIKPVSEFETKGIAGKIIPALATTTAVVSGLVSIELLKLIKFNKQPQIENFKNTYLSLGISFIGSSEPIQCHSKNIGKLKVNLWTQLKLKDTTLQNLLMHFESEYNISITNIMYKDKIVYSTFINKNKMNELLNKNFSTILETKDNINLSINIEDIDNDEINEIIILHLKC